MKTTLLIMAAGIGSRFGTGIKQLEPVDDANHIIMDYSIHDAIEAGFNHVVFIIRKDIEKEFKGSSVTVLPPFALLMMSLWTTLSRISTTSRELCRKDVQSRGEPVRLCLRRRKQSKPHSL